MRRLSLLALLLALAACDVNPFDESQQPTVRVDVTGEAPVFSWLPAGAQSLRVYEGANTGDAGSDVMVWGVSAVDGANGLRGPVTYSVVPSGGELYIPARPLVAGQPYTVVVRRDDPRGTGDGFTNTRNEYADAETFIP
ncbi:hypothetical protein [Rubrivirga sp. IMCC43871]|uniref:hypothetical protein n=1 Tax=Rubrivirga sp. IMCC43871 TaxID=3391575 RepID=UPI00398FB5CD